MEAAAVQLTLQVRRKPLGQISAQGVGGAEGTKGGTLGRLARWWNPKKNRDGQMGKAVRRDLRLFYDVPMHPRGRDLYEIAINSDSAPLSNPAWRAVGSDPAMLFQSAADRWEETHASEWVQWRLGEGLVKVLPHRDGHRLSQLRWFHGYSVTFVGTSLRNPGSNPPLQTKISKAVGYIR